MKRLIGKKVWVVQFDDEHDSIIGVVDSFDQGFVSLRNGNEEEPSLYVNLTNVKEIEIYRPEGEGELRILRFPGADKDKGGGPHEPG